VDLSVNISEKFPKHCISKMFGRDIEVKNGKIPSEGNGCIKGRPFGLKNIPILL
jgi:hypothetical protein